jgi:cell division protein ZapD
VAEAALDEVIGRIDHAFAGLNQLQGKAGQALAGNDWLMSIRSRISIPGGTCEFDLPAYYAWQQHAPSAAAPTCRAGWHAAPLAEALQVLLGLLRDSGAPQRMVAPAASTSRACRRARPTSCCACAWTAATAWCPRSAATG